MKNKEILPVTFGDKIIGRGYQDETGKLIITESSPELECMMTPADVSFSVRLDIPDTPSVVLDVVEKIKPIDTSVFRASQYKNLY